MPMYEFYCPECHTIFTFLSRSINTEKIPACPRDAGHSLRKKVSRFAITGTAKEPSDDSLEDLPLDEARMEQAMQALAGEVEKEENDDPRKAAQLMRKFSDIAGIGFNDTIEDALSRLESGEDPEALEQEMSEVLDNDDNPFFMRKKIAAQTRPPARDETLYDM